MNLHVKDVIGMPCSLVFSFELFEMLESDGDIGDQVNQTRYDQLVLRRKSFFSLHLPTC